VRFEDASQAQGLRKPSEREGELRIVSIEGLDRSACGGTHVRSTAEIGPVAIRKLDKIRGNVRIEFLCGLRAIRRARSDYQALSKVARVFSAALDDVPEAGAAQTARMRTSRRRTANSLPMRLRARERTCMRRRRRGPGRSGSAAVG